MWYTPDDAKTGASQKYADTRFYRAITTVSFRETLQYDMCSFLRKLAKQMNTNMRRTADKFTRSLVAERPQQGHTTKTQSI